MNLGQFSMGHVGRRLVGKVAPDLAATISLGRYAKQWVLPTPLAEPEYYTTERVLPMDSIDTQLDDQLGRLARWAADSSYQGVYDALRRDEQINVPFHLGDYRNTGALHNGYYPTPDAEIYASMILDYRPEQIVEVGSGFSTRIARKAVSMGNLGSRITVVDPEPRTTIRDIADDVIAELVERSKLIERIDWTKKTILFIDSSHVCRSRGDVPYLFCELVPSLPSGTVVHVHDIFLPFDYPANYDQWMYTEQYVLHALLAHSSSRFRVALMTYFLSRRHTARMQETFCKRIGSDPLLPGASFWFEVI